VRAAAHIEQIIDGIENSQSADRVRSQLIAQLDERAPVYQGLDRGAADRLRGYFLSCFANIGLPAAALPYVQEELELGDNGYCMAAAARSLSGADTVPDWACDGLLLAIERLLYANDVICFTPRAWMDGPATTVLAELFAALGQICNSARPALPRLREIAMMQPSPFDKATADALERAIERIDSATPASACCCDNSAVSTANFAPVARGNIDTRALHSLRFEDMQSRVATFSEIFDRRINLIAFFYTRCMNPLKCSSTIEKLAALQERLGPLASECRIGAISYDSKYDTATRLRTYGSNRGIGSDSPVRLLRSLEAIDPLINHFNLGVGYGEATVNRHRSEVFLLDESLQSVGNIVRTQFEINDALDLIGKLLSSSDSRTQASEPDTIH